MKQTSYLLQLKWFKYFGVICAHLMTFICSALLTVRLKINSPNYYSILLIGRPNESDCIPRVPYLISPKILKISYLSFKKIEWVNLSIILSYAIFNRWQVKKSPINDHFRTFSHCDIVSLIFSFICLLFFVGVLEQRSTPGVGAPGSDVNWILYMTF